MESQNETPPIQGLVIGEGVVGTPPTAPASQPKTNESNLPQQGGTNTGGEQLYCNKYKTPEELAKGYSEQQKYINSLTEAKKEQEARLAALAPPNEYSVPKTLAGARADALKVIAKNSNLTQTQLDAIANTILDSDRKVAAALDAKKASLGDRYDLLKHSAELQYPGNKSLQEAVVNTALQDQTAADALLERRDDLLRSTLPNSTSAPTVVNIDDLRDKASTAYMKYRADGQAKDFSEFESLNKQITEIERQQIALGQLKTYG